MKYRRRYYANFGTYMSDIVCLRCVSSSGAKMVLSCRLVVGPSMLARVSSSIITQKLHQRL